MQADLFLTKTNNQSQNYLINFNFLELIQINHTCSVPPKQNACKMQKLNHVISFNLTVRFKN